MEKSDTQDSKTKPRYRFGWGKRKYYDNPWDTGKFPSFWDVIKSLPDYFKQKTPTQEDIESVTITPPNITPQLQRPPTDGRLQITWFGHSTCLVQLDGWNILTDPLFGKSCHYLGGEYTRLTPVPIKIDQLPPIDIVLISNNHGDHLDIATVKDLHDSFGKNITWLVPEGLKAYFKEHMDLIDNVTELKWWEERTLDAKKDKTSIRLVCLPSQHFSSTSIWNKNETLWCSWAVIGSESRFYFAGDTGYCSVFKDIATEFGQFTVAAIPIGGGYPRPMMKNMHVNPEEAFQIHKDLGAKASIGIHWGTFSLGTEDFLHPKQEVERLGEKKFKIVKQGETNVFRRKGHKTEPSESNQDETKSRKTQPIQYKEPEDRDNAPKNDAANIPMREVSTQGKSKDSKLGVPTSNDDIQAENSNTEQPGEKKQSAKEVGEPKHEKTTEFKRNRNRRGSKKANASKSTDEQGTSQPSTPSVSKSSIKVDLHETPKEKPHETPSDGQNETPKVEPVSDRTRSKTQTAKAKYDYTDLTKPEDNPKVKAINKPEDNAMIKRGNTENTQPESTDDTKLEDHGIPNPENIDLTKRKNIEKIKKPNNTGVSSQELCEMTNPERHATFKQGSEEIELPGSEETGISEPENIDLIKLDHRISITPEDSDIATPTKQQASTLDSDVTKPENHASETQEDSESNKSDNRTPEEPTKLEPETTKPEDKEKREEDHTLPRETRV